jgi:hypothetical protein
MKFILIIAQLADSLTFWWLMILGYIFLYRGDVLSASALICTAVFYQRAWKAELLKMKLEKLTKETKE